MSPRLSNGLIALTFLISACSKRPDATDAGISADAAAAAGPALKADLGVDADKKVVRIGFLNDESGPGAVVGKPFALGKRILSDAINAGDTNYLPAGWRIESIERDHGYNPQKSLQEFQAIRDDVLFLGTSFGTPNTLPLLPHLKRDNLLAFPASLSSLMADNPETPPLGPSYKVEAMRGLDYVLASAPDKKKACIVYQNDDYGKDGLDGWKQATTAAGVPLLAAQGIAPGQKDFTAVVTGLREAGCTHVLLTVLPSATGPLLGSAAQVGFAPQWIGHMTSWIDRFFDPSVIPSEVFKNYVLVTSFPIWGEKVPGMDAFLAHYERFGKDKHPPDTYVLAGYIQALITVEALKRAIDSGDVTRAGLKRALSSMDRFDAGGLIQPLDYSKQPYVTSTRTRVLKPDFPNKTFVEVAPFAEPQTRVNRFVLSIENLEVVYQTVLSVLRGVSLEVPEGRAVALLGPNGAGKTTLLRALSGLLPIHDGRITKGSVRLGAADVTRAAADRMHRAGVVPVLEGRRIFREMSVEDNLRAGGVRRPRQDVARMLAEFYERFPILGQRRSDPAGFLSGGEQQLLAITRALIAEPKMLLLDEPSLGLAPIWVTRVYELLRDVRARGVSILLVEQKATVALELADHGYILENGRIVLDGPSAVLKEDADVKEFYLGGAARNYRDIKQYRRRRRWLS